ncbi:ABC transporter permease [Streptosporangium amethystogenes]|uniref:ABC transporter permease n=1 Tax=Streptosporangium amethystogenes TaxID=2002 RepID=UPI00069256CF|nr:ABC transporter permease [Streptosporangium amethystogenes]
MSATQTQVVLPTTARRKWLTPAVREHLQVYLPLLVIVIALSALASSRNGAFLSTMNLERMLVASSVLGILAVGQTFLLVGGQLDLSVGSLVSLGSVLTAKLVAGEVPDVVIVLVAVLVGAASGALWGLLVSLLRVPPFILTLGGLAVFASIALTVAKSTPIPLPTGLDWLQTGSFLGLRTPTLIWLLCVIVGGVLLHFTRFGRNVFALGANEEAAFLSGIATTRTKIAIFVLNGTLAGLAAVVITGRVGAGDPRAGIGLELVVIAAIVLGGASLAGGRGSILGSLLGVLVLGVVTSSLTFLSVPDSYDQFVFGAILIAAVSVTAGADFRRRRKVQRRA